MRLMSLQLPNSSTSVSGTVEIHPSAAIAPGALLQADPESEIIIAAGVCIGMGAILHAHQGILEVEEGVTIGAGTLIVGQGKIGANACIGPATTILSQSINPGAVIAAGSLLGDTSRQVKEQPSETTASAEVATPTDVSAVAGDAANPSESLDTETVSSQEEAPATTSTPVVYGQAHLNRLLSTLMPHRQALNQALDEQSSPNSG